MATVVLAETIDQAVLVFVNPPLQVVGHSDIDHPRLAGNYVNAVALMLIHSGCTKEVPPLRIAIDEANRNAAVGMTDYFTFTA
jgi:hypothetical protein